MYTTGKEVETKICVIAFFNVLLNTRTCSSDVVRAWINEGYEVVAIFIKDEQVHWDDIDSAWHSVHQANTYRSSYIRTVDEENRTFRTRSGSLYNFS